MDYALLAIAFTLIVGLTVGIARALLACLFCVMTRRSLPFVFYWRRVIFVSALFWFWYLTPAIAGSRATTRVMLLLVSPQHSMPRPPVPRDAPTRPGHLPEARELTYPIR